MVLASKQTQTPSIHHRKRHGQHHKTTKAYHKTYWPYLPLIAIIGFGLTVNSLWFHQSHSVLGYATDLSTTELFTNTNVQRIAQQEQPLQLNVELDTAAQAKASSMARLNYWSHTSPSGETPGQFITAAGYTYSVAGENLAYGFSTSHNVVAAWMGSPEHRANILSTSYTDVGFGIANVSNYQGSGPQTIVVAEYAKPAIGVAAVTSNTPPALASSGTAVSRLQLASNNDTSFSAFTVSTLLVVCLVAFFVNQGLMWRRMKRYGKVFILRYHLLDILLVGIGVAGFILTRNAGFIH